MMKLLTENSELRDDFRMYGGFKYHDNNDNNLVININTGDMLCKRKDIRDAKS